MKDFCSLTQYLQTNAGRVLLFISLPIHHNPIIWLSVVYTVDKVSLNKPRNCLYSLPGNSYTALGYSWIFSVPPGKSYDSTLKKVMTASF
jgi:hypothetical protein